MPSIKFNTTADIKVPKTIAEQVIGQDEAVEVIKKASLQRRHVLLIGEPGTGKSMLGLAVAEMLPKEKLVDVIAFPNPNDENMPLIRTVPAGQGRDLIARARIQSMGMFKSQNVVMFILVIIAMLAPWWIWSYYSKYGNVVAAIMTAASLVVAMLVLVGFMLSLNLSRRINGKMSVPRIIVDNFKRKQAPFNDATGSHAGALLGDVLHDPFQSFFSILKINKVKDNKIESLQINKELNNLFNRYKTEIYKKQKNNYEAIHIPKDELLILGETNGSIAPVEVLSVNRYDYNGKMIKLTTSANKELIVTPEHKIAVNKNGKIAYLEAKKVKSGDEIISKAEDVIIDEQDIINTYDERQQQQCKLYYQYLDIKLQNPSWGYKRIAKAMNQPIGKTRWWHANKHIPVPLQTANWLKERGLLPLRTNDPKLPLIAKVLGATFGDGGIFENLNGIFLSSSEKEAVEEFKKDLEEIFSLKNNENSRIIEGGVYGHSWCYQNTNRNVIRFFMALGAPIGNKTKIALYIPTWISLNGKSEDEFYSSFLGGEMTSPIIQKDRTSLSSVEVGITGSKELKDNRIEFLNKVAEYLNKKHISTTSIYEGNTKNENLNIFRLLISKTYDNIIKFMIEIKLNYCSHKVKRFYEAIAQLTSIKKKMYEHLIQSGMGAESAMNKLRLTPNSLYLILTFFDQNPKAEAYEGTIT